VVWIVRENICWVLPADVHNNAVEDIHRVPCNTFRACASQSYITYEIHRSIATRRIQLQRCVSRKCPVADSEHAIVSQSGDFNYISVSIDRVAQVRAADIDLSTSAGVPDIDRSAICYQPAIHVRDAAGAGSKNCHLAARAGRSGIEQGQQLRGVQNVNRDSAWLIAPEREIAPGLAQT